jgi:hypothetical protein
VCVESLTMPRWPTFDIACEFRDGGLPFTAIAGLPGVRRCKKSGTISDEQMQSLEAPHQTNVARDVCVPSNQSRAEVSSLRNESTAASKVRIVTKLVESQVLRARPPQRLRARAWPLRLLGKYAMAPAVRAEGAGISGYVGHCHKACSSSDNNLKCRL